MVLAGGAATRMGGAKATAQLAGRPLVAWALDALRAAGLDELAVAAKPDTPLPELAGVAVWREPAEPRHPLAGVRHALERAGGRAIVTLPVDLPLVPGAVLRTLAEAEGCAVARAGGRLQPLVARFEPGTALPESGRATDAVLALHPLVVDVPADGFLNVNAPSDLAAANARLRPG
ncbi:MAG TPA: molybdenum cofactor guanylyltransferase [Solirubrobacteraceae bacterium]